MYQLVLALGQYQLDDWITKRLKSRNRYNWLCPDYADLTQINPDETIDELVERVHQNIFDMIMDLASVNKNKFYRHVSITISVIMIDDENCTVYTNRIGNGCRKFHTETSTFPIHIYEDGFIYLVHAWHNGLLATQYEDAIQYGIKHCNGHQFFIYVIRTKHIGGPDFDFAQNRFVEESRYNAECCERIKNLTNPEDIRKIILEYVGYEFHRFNSDGTFDGGYRSNCVDVTQHTFDDPSFVADLKNTKYPITMDID